MILKQSTFALLLVVTSDLMANDRPGFRKDKSDEFTCGFAPEQTDNTPAAPEEELAAVTASSTITLMFPKKPKGRPGAASAGQYAIPLFTLMDMKAAMGGPGEIMSLPFHADHRDWLKLPDRKLETLFLPPVIRHEPVYMLTDIQATDPDQSEEATVQSLFQRLDAAQQKKVLRKLALHLKKVQGMKLATPQQRLASLQLLQENCEGFMAGLARVLTGFPDQSEPFIQFHRFVTSAVESEPREKPGRSPASRPVYRLSDASLPADSQMSLADFECLTGIRVVIQSAQASPAWIDAARVMSFLTSSHLLGRLPVTQAQNTFADSLCQTIDHISMSPAIYRLHWLAEQVERMLLQEQEAGGLPTNLRLVFHHQGSQVVRVISFQPGRGARLATSLLEDQRLREVREDWQGKQEVGEDCQGKQEESETFAIMSSVSAENTPIATGASNSQATPIAEPDGLAHFREAPRIELATPQRMAADHCEEVDTELHLTLNTDNLTTLQQQLLDHQLAPLSPVWYSRDGTVADAQVNNIERHLLDLLRQALGNWFDGRELVPQALVVKLKMPHVPAGDRDSTASTSPVFLHSRAMAGRVRAVKGTRQSYVFNDRGFYRLLDGYEGAHTSTDPTASVTRDMPDIVLLNQIRQLLVEDRSIPVMLTGLCVVFRITGYEPVRLLYYRASGGAHAQQQTLASHYDASGVNHLVTLSFSDRHALKRVLGGKITILQAREEKQLQIEYETVKDSAFADQSDVRRYVEDLLQRWSQKSGGSYTNRMF